MKKLKLSELNLGSADVLTREQLKKILGGDGSSPDSTCSCSCSCSDGSTRNATISDCAYQCTAQDNVGVSCGTSTQSCATICSISL